MASFDPPEGETDLDRVINRISDAFNSIKSGHALSAEAAADQQRLLIHAVKTKNTTALQKILTHKQDLNAADASGDRLLHHAARTGDADIIRLLIEAGANPLLGQEKNPEQQPMDEAINFGNVAACIALAQNGGYDRSGRLSPLHKACERGKSLVVAAFLQVGINPNEQTASGSTALLIATFRKEYTIMESLLAIDVVTQAMNSVANHNDSKARNAFLAACERAPLATIDSMLQKGALVNAQTKQSQSGFELALDAGKFDAAERLLQTTIDVEPINPAQSSLLYITCSKKHISHKKETFELIKDLMQRGADPDAVNHSTGLTPLHVAIIADDHDCAKPTDILLTYGAKQNIHDRQGRLPIHIAIESGRKNILNALINHGADVNSTEKVNHQTALMMAAKKGDMAMIDQLNSAGANPMLVDNNGHSALIHAQNAGHQDAVTKLIQMMQEWKAQHPKPPSSFKGFS